MRVIISDAPNCIIGDQQAGPVKSKLRARSALAGSVHRVVVAGGDCRHGAAGEAGDAEPHVLALALELELELDRAH